MLVDFLTLISPNKITLKLQTSLIARSNVNVNAWNKRFRLFFENRDFSNVAKIKSFHIFMKDNGTYQQLSINFQGKFFNFPAFVKVAKFQKIFIRLIFKNMTEITVHQLFNLIWKITFLQFLRTIENNFWD